MDSHSTSIAASERSRGGGNKSGFLERQENCLNGVKICHKLEENLKKCDAGREESNEKCEKGKVKKCRPAPSLVTSSDSVTTGLQRHQKLPVSL